MRSALIPIVLCMGLALLASSVRAEEILLNDGKTREAEILSVDEDGITVKGTAKSGGTVQMKVPWRRLDRNYYYNLRKEQVGDDAKAHLKLALWCVEADMFAQAKEHIQRATELDPELVKDLQAGGKLVEIRENIAKRVLEAAERDIKDEDYDAAERKFEALLARMPDTEAGTQAAERYEEFNVKRDEYQAKKEQEELEKLAEEEQKREKELRKKVEPIKRELERARESMRKGLVEDSDTQALRLLEDAIRRGEKAIEMIDKALAEFADDEAVQKRGAEVRQETIDGIVKAHIHRADIYGWRGDYSNAREELGKAEVLDPDNPALADAMNRARYEYADEDYGLRLRRGPRDGVRFRRGAAARGGGGRRR